MNDYMTLINVIYNPARYCDESWLNAPDAVEQKAVKNLSTLPAYVKNHFILRQTNSFSIAEHDVEENHYIALFINNWAKIKYAAYLIGLKLCSAQIINAPSYMRNLTPSERAFLCLPLPVPLSAATRIETALNDSHIRQAGAQFIYNVAAAVLPSVILARLRLIFPDSYRYDHVIFQNLHAPLSVLKWAFDYA